MWCFLGGMALLATLIALFFFWALIIFPPEPKDFYDDGGVGYDRTPPQHRR
jgi:hypothetical protein